MDSVELWIERLGWILPLWLLALGSIIGSFLNVIVYRLPAGKSLIYPGSRCPACGHDIRWYHNLPILSWFVLRARCYDCGAKIAARYPLVELATGLLFAGLAAVEVWPLATRDLHQLAQPLHGPMITGADVLASYSYHLWLLCTLLSAALIAWDGHRIPRGLIWPALGIGLIGPIWWPALVQPRFIMAVAPARWSTSQSVNAMATAALGLAAGHAVGWAGQRIARRQAENSSDRGSPALLTAATGAFLGWQGAVAVGILALVMTLAARLIDGRRLAASEQPAEGRTVANGQWGWATGLFAGTLLWIMAMQWLQHGP